MKMDKKALDYINENSKKERDYITTAFKIFMQKPTDKSQNDLLRGICAYKQRIEELENKAVKEGV